MNNEQLKSKIMRRVYFIWFVRKVAPRFLAEVVLFGTFLYVIGRNVFIAKVFQYMGQIFGNHSIDPAVWSSFAFNTFVNTELIVQLSVLGSIAVIFFIFRDVFKSAIRISVAKRETELMRQTLQ
jgi:hypothetical protein